MRMCVGIFTGVPPLAKEAYKGPVFTRTRGAVVGQPLDDGSNRCKSRECS